MSGVLILANHDVGLYQFRKELIQELLKENEVYISLPNGDMIQPLVGTFVQEVLRHGSYS